MFENLNPKPLLPTRVARLEELLLGKTTYSLQPEKFVNYVLNSYGFYKKQETFPFDIWNIDNQAIMHLYRAGIKQRRQLHIQNVKHTWWRPKSVRRSSGRIGYTYKPQSAQEKVISSIKSEITDQTESSIDFEPIRRIQTLAENVRDESISLDEVRPILRNISQEMVHGVIEGSEERSSKFLEILEQNQQVTLIGEEMKSNISEPNYGEQVNRQNSILSEISAKELAEVFLNDLTDNVSVYLEDILDELLQNNNNDDNKDLQS
ncbi:hypothetical protein MS3_00006613 [Schistosoma haematobium]|uniref:Uncharacterized protein n=1 Tax=Schistosoma haematobium TaxID=6185 RepID=A0A922ISR4_SCHHA|nr:hypothetical protein MS3_00006613 [Schistosoma haematobium]KAH9585299.1 hypothetical protein MS3_00006613 [Schistosoma haematobium]